MKIKQHTQSVLAAIFALNCFYSVCLAAPIYAQLTSSGDQITSSKNSNTPIPVELQNIDFIAGMTWDTHQNKLLIKSDGTYLIMCDVQAGAHERVNLPSDGGNINYWIELNGKELTNSSNLIHVSPGSKSNTIGDQYIGHFKSGDSLQFMYSASIANIGLITLRSTELRPAATGVTISIIKLADNLSSVSLVRQPNTVK